MNLGNWTASELRQYISRKDAEKRVRERERSLLIAKWAVCGIAVIYVLMVGFFLLFWR